MREPEPAYQKPKSLILQQLKLDINLKEMQIKLLQRAKLTGVHRTKPK